MNRRFRDKTTFWICIGFLFIFFIISIFFLTNTYFTFWNFWSSATVCYINEDFECLSNLIEKHSGIKAKYNFIFSGLASFSSAIIGFYLVIIYKINSNSKV